MFLIVARRVTVGVRIFGDTKLTHRQPVRDNYLNGNLKSVLLGPRMCVSHAGSQSVALDAIRDLPRGDPDPTEVEAALASASRRHDSAADFLVACLSEPPYLARIRGGTVETGGDQLWIGDRAGYDAFQRYFHTGDRSEGHEPYGPLTADDSALVSRLASALTAVIEDEAIDSVGHLPIVVSTQPDGFMYYPQLMRDGGAATTQLTEDWGDITMGGTAEGGFSYNICVTRHVGVPVVGAHFREGNIGVVFNPLLSDYAFNFPNMGYVSFIDSRLAEPRRAHPAGARPNPPRPASRRRSSARHRWIQAQTIRAHV